MTHQRSASRSGAGHADLELDRHSKLRLVPLPLADLPDHSRRGRAGAQACAIHLGDGPDAADHGSQLPLRRDADPSGSDRRDVARADGDRRSPALRSTAATRDRRVVGRRWCRRLRRRQHRVGPEPLRRPGRMRPRRRNRHQRFALAARLIDLSTRSTPPSDGRRHAQLLHKAPARRHLLRPRPPRPSRSINDRRTRSASP